MGAHFATSSVYHLTKQRRLFLLIQFIRSGVGVERGGIVAGVLTQKPVEKDPLRVTEWKQNLPPLALVSASEATAIRLASNSLRNCVPTMF
jgi:hypothetical protein